MLNDANIAHYQQLLVLRKVEIEEQIKNMTESCEPVSPNPSIGRLTRNDAMQDQQMALHLRRRLEFQQLQIASAFERIKTGKYGMCVLCKKGIGHKGLEIVPEAPLCVECLEKRTDKVK